MRWICTGLLGLCACDALFGLDHIETMPADASVDGAPLITISGSLVREYIHQDANDAPVVEAVPYATAETPLAVTRADGSPAQLTWNPATGGFSFETGEGERYAVTVTGCGPPREYQATSAVLALVDECLGRPDQLAPGPATELEFSLPGPVASGDITEIASMGVWSATAISSTTNPYGLVWPKAKFALNQAPARLSTAGNDTAYFLDYAAIAGTPSYRALYSLIKAKVDLGAGKTSVFTSPASTMRTSCIDAYYRHASELARLGARFPQYTSESAGTAIESAPAAKHGLDMFYELASVSELADNHAPMQYATPFTGHDILVLSNVAGSRTTHGTTIGVATGTWDTITPGTACTRHDDPAGGSLPYGARLANIALTDDVTVGIAPDRPIELTWSAEAGPVAPTLVFVSLIRADNTVVRHYAAPASAANIRIDPALLDAGTFYTMTITLNNALANTAAGDFRLLEPSFTAGVYQTPYFTVSK